MDHASENQPFYAADQSFDRGRDQGPLHIVSAWACERGLSLGQRQVEAKSNEITAIPALLDALALKGSLVTLDAMGRQRAIAARQIEERIRTLDQAIEDAVKPWRFGPIVDALRAFSVSTQRLPQPWRPRSARSGVFQIRASSWPGWGWFPASIPVAAPQGGDSIAKTGNALARTMMVEASWSYRHLPREQHPYLKRSAHLPQEIKNIGWKAQTRLCKRYRDLYTTGKPQPRVPTAVARELAGFIWDIARKISLSA